MRTSLVTLCRAHVEGRIEAVRESMACFNPVSEAASAPSTLSLASSADSGVLEPEDINVDGPLEPEDTNLSTETLVAPDSDHLCEDLDETSTLQLDTLISTTPTPESTDAPSTSSAPTGHLDNLSTTSPYRGNFGFRACFGLRPSECINALLFAGAGVFGKCTSCIIYPLRLQPS